MTRLLRASILVAAVAIVAALTASGCSYVDPPVLAMAANSSEAPYYTLSREDMYKDLDAQAGQAGQTSTTKGSYSTDDTATYLNKKVNEEFLKRFMEEQHIEVTDEDTQLAQQIASASGSSSSPSADQLQQQAKLVAINRKLANDAYTSGKVDKEQKLREFYEANKAQMGTPAQVCIHLIGIQAGAADATSAPTEADYADAQRRAAAVKQRLATESFETVADSASQIPNGPKGGDVGCVDESRLPTDVQPGVDALAVAAVSDPLRTQGGFFIVRLDERKPVQIATFEQARAQIEPQVAQQIGQQLLKDVIGDVIRRTQITIDPRFGSWDTSKYTVTAPAGAAEPTMPTSTTTPLSGLSVGGRNGAGSSSAQTPSGS